MRLLPFQKCHSFDNGSINLLPCFPFNNNLWFYLILSLSMLLRYLCFIFILFTSLLAFYILSYFIFIILSSFVYMPLVFPHVKFMTFTVVFLLILFYNLFIFSLSDVCKCVCYECLNFVFCLLCVCMCFHVSYVWFSFLLTS